MTGLAYRRYQDQRQKSRANRWLRDRMFYPLECITSSRIGQRAATRVTCSGPCCGNPRRHFGVVTRQEMRCQTS